MDLHDTTQGYYWWFRMGYSYSNAPPGDKKKVVNIFETETNNNFHLPHGNRTDNQKPSGLAMGEWMTSNPFTDPGSNSSGISKQNT